MAAGCLIIFTKIHRADLVLLSFLLAMRVGAESGPPPFTGDAEFNLPGQWEMAVGVGYSRGAGARSVSDGPMRSRLHPASAPR